MFSIILVVLAVILIAVFWKKTEKGWEDHDVPVIGVIITFLLIIGLGTLLIVNGNAYYRQITRLEAIRACDGIKVVYKAKAEALTAEFTKLLAETYPQYEKDIFGQITPEKVAVFIVKYPEIRASETIKELVAQINKLQSDIYEQDIQKEKLLQDVRVNLRNPFILPILPKE